MAVGIFSASSQGSSNHFVVCPTWQAGACACPIKQVPGGDGGMVNDPASTLATPHRTFDFGAAVPAGWTMATAPAEWLALGKTQTQWAALTAAQQWGFTCAVEAIRLVKHDMAQAASTPLSAFVGVTA